MLFEAIQKLCKSVKQQNSFDSLTTCFLEVVIQHSDPDSKDNARAQRACLNMHQEAPAALID